MKTLVVIFLVVSIRTASIAQDEETKCCCSTYDMSVCLSKVHDKIDADLNATYQKALDLTKRLGEQDVENLRDAERKWIEYRDATCKAEYGLWGGGSGGPNARAMCVIRLTRQRVADLKNVYTKMNR